MRVYIKGIEMPKDGEHPYWVVIHSDGTVEYNENKGQGWQTSKAVPVPPHGRWIKHIDHYICSACADSCWADSALEYDYCPSCGAKMEKGD